MKNAGYINAGYFSLIEFCMFLEKKMRLLDDPVGNKPGFVEAFR